MESDSLENEIDLHRIILRYAHTRVKNETVLNRLRCSIERYGQLTPVLIVPAEDNRFVLIDGYLRVLAINKIGSDTVMAQISDVEEKDALICVLGKGNERQLDAIEQAAIIAELIEQFDMSMSEVAQKMARDKSWVKRRLDLIRSLPEESMCAVQSGRVSLWSASRVLAPLARANSEHAQQLTRHLIEHPMPTRQLGQFFDHYKKSNRQIRQRMIDEPSMFLRAQQSKKQQLEADKVKRGPEGSWLRDIRIVSKMLLRLLDRMKTVFYQGQPESDRIELVRAFNKAKEHIERINEEIVGYD